MSSQPFTHHNSYQLLLSLKKKLIIELNMLSPALESSGYDSLHSTPKQQNDRNPVKGKATDSSDPHNEEIDDNLSSASYETFTWKSQWSKVASFVFSRQNCFSSQVEKEDPTHPNKESNGKEVPQVNSTNIEHPTEDTPLRLEWSKKTDFLLSIIGFAVDLANVS